MNSNIFSIKTDVDGVSFVCNRDTGKWVISNYFNEEVESSLTRPFSPQPFTGTRMIALNMGRACNFDCIYCLVGDLKSEKDEMTKKVGIKTIDKLAELDPIDRHLVFHGSEPLLNFKLIRELILYTNKVDKEIKFSIQSNGSLLNDCNIAFLVKNKVGIGISIDGKEAHQNRNRPYLGSRNSFKKVIDNLIKINEIQKGVSLITVLTKYNIEDLEEIIRYYEKLNLRSVLFHPANPITDSSFVPPDNILIQEVKNIFNRYLRMIIDGKNTVQIIKFKKILSIFFKPKTTLNCLQCGAGPKHPLLAIDIDGTIYPCDYVWGKKEYSIGNILNDSLYEAMNSNNNFRVSRNVDNIEECNKCNWKHFCGGGCPGSSIASGRNLESKSFYCNYNKELFKYMAQKIPLMHKYHLIRDILNNRY